jgi:hypothetical protein
MSTEKAEGLYMLNQNCAFCNTAAKVLWAPSLKVDAGYCSVCLLEAARDCLAMEQQLEGVFLDDA